MNKIKKNTHAEFFELVPVVSSGEYACVEITCDVMQTDDDTEDILFYGDNDEMYCIKHIINHVANIS